MTANDDYNQAVSDALRDLRPYFQVYYHRLHIQGLLHEISSNELRHNWLGLFEKESNRLGEIFLPRTFSWDIWHQGENQLAFYYKVKGSPYSKRGRIRYEGRWLDSFSLHYDDETVRFNVRIKNAFGCYIGEQGPKSHDFRRIGGYYYSEQKELTEVPLTILRTWMKGKMRSPESNVILHSIDDYYLEYSEGAYPIPLYRLFRSLGEKAFDVMLDLNYVNPDVHEIITEELQELSNLLDLRTQEQVEPIQEPPAAKEKPPQEQHVPNIPQATLDGLKVSGKDKEKLIVIEGVKEYLSYSQWAKLLGFKGKAAAFSSFKRLQGEGLISLDKTSDGVKVVLTDKGKSVIHGSI